MYIGDAENAVGSLVLDIHADTLVGTYMRASGQIIDKFEMQRIGSCDTLSHTDIKETASNIVVKVFSDYKTGDFKIRFDLLETTPVKIKLMDMNGKIIYSHDFGDLQQGAHYHTIQTSTNNIAAGMYNFAIITDKTVVSKRVFKLKL